MKNGKQNWVPVSRVCGNDLDGILYIGMSTPLRGGRVSELKKSLSPISPTNGHQAGVRYRSNGVLQSLFPFENLKLELIAADTSQDAGCLEGQKLKEYMEKFGEVPPLNQTK